MNVKELKDHLEPMRDDDQVWVEFPDLYEGGYDTSDNVAVSTVVEDDVLVGRRARFTITATT